VLQVGDGRGFHVGDFVLTAAHCLPRLPPPMTMTCIEDRTYAATGKSGNHRIGLISPQRSAKDRTLGSADNL